MSFFGHPTPEDTIKVAFEFLNAWMRGDMRTRVRSSVFCSAITDFEIKTGGDWKIVYTSSSGRWWIVWGLGLLAVAGLGWLIAYQF